MLGETPPPNPETFIQQVSQNNKERKQQLVSRKGKQLRRRIAILYLKTVRLDKFIKKKQDGEQNSAKTETFTVT